MIYNFKARNPILLALEGEYEGFTFSCRHRDILRCSITRHFRSCYSPDGLFKETPKNACVNPSIAILFERDRSGQFLWRAFVKLNFKTLLVGKFYGNPRNNVEDYIKGKLSLPLKLRLQFTGVDLTAL